MCWGWSRSGSRTRGCPDSQQHRRREGDRCSRPGRGGAGRPARRSRAARPDRCPLTVCRRTRCWPVPAWSAVLAMAECRGLPRGPAGVTRIEITSVPPGPAGGHPLGSTNQAGPRGSRPGLVPPRRSSHASVPARAGADRTVWRCKVPQLSCAASRVAGSAWLAARPMSRAGGAGRAGRRGQHAEWGHQRSRGGQQGSRRRGRAPPSGWPGFAVAASRAAPPR